jgi:hypothetical protein
MHRAIVNEKQLPYVIILRLIVILKLKHMFIFVFVFSVT